jgi:tRNA dimethylallyltransferase
MTSDLLRSILILTGPTGSGKTPLGIRLADRLGAEIVSMDSMTLYRGMDIGTAKPGPEERQRVRHHLLDMLEPWESASVAWWLEKATEAVREIQGRGKRVLFVGGTPLYLKALLRGLFDAPSVDPQLRQRLAKEAARVGGQALHDTLARVDPATAKRVHPHDIRRVIRALEVWESTGQPISFWQQQWSKSCPDATNGLSIPFAPGENPIPNVLCLDLRRSELYARIDARVRHMIAAGLVEEAAGLRRLPHPMSREAMQALGYKELFEYLDGKTTLEEAIQRIQTRSRNLAKRQLTWFRHLPECRLVTPELTFAAWGLTMDE